MDINKLKLDKFNSIKLVNFPQDIDLGIDSTDENNEVLIYYIDKVEDVNEFVNLSRNSDLPKENRTIMIYKKGRKDGVNRDSIFMPFKTNEITGFKLKAPMVCSLSKDLTAIVLMKVE